MITVDVKQFFKDYSIFGFFWCQHAPSVIRQGVRERDQLVWRLRWRWNWHEDLEEDWNCTVWHRCYKRHARLQFK